MKAIIVLSAVIISCLAQRSPFAGTKPIGFPYVAPVTADTNGLGNRFGDGEAGSTTTIRLPLEALGDADLVARLSRLPESQQPFWLLNYKALEANRKNPQTYPQRGNSFVDGNSNSILQS